MRIDASTWEARRVSDVLLDGHLVQSVTRVDNVQGYVDVIRTHDGQAVMKHVATYGDVHQHDPVIDRLYGRVTIIYPRLSKAQEDRSQDSRRKRRRRYRNAQTHRRTFA